MNFLRNFNPIKIGAYAIVAVIGLVVLLSSFYTVPTGHKGIVLQFNEVSDITDPGLNFKIPFVQSVVKVDTRTNRTEEEISANTSDMQRATTRIVVNYHLNPQAVKKIYSETGLDVETRIIAPRILDVTKNAFTKYNSQQLANGRDALRQIIIERLRPNLLKYGIIVEDVQLTDITFSDKFYEAIEAKQIAEQSALKAENDLKRIKVEGEQRVVSAKAEAESIKIQAEAIKANGGEEYVRLTAIKKWDGRLPTTMVPGTATPMVHLK
ncbi:putative protease [Acinetobacter phage SH-Ab 15599]|nr:putative protease [Acinetobacter phage SH-Ab 15599]